MIKIFTYKLFITSLFFITSCSSKDSLQSYFVNHQEESGFMSVDIPISFLSNGEIGFSEDQIKAINTIDKLNVISYSIDDGNLDEFNFQLSSVKNILKSNTYNDLIRMGTGAGGKVKILYIENNNTIDEIIIFGYTLEMGFAIVRVLGNDMNLFQIMKLGSVIDQLDTQHSNMDSFMKYLL